jgi:hypothetical protein
MSTQQREKVESVLTPICGAVAHRCHVRLLSQQLGVRFQSAGCIQSKLACSHGWRWLRIILQTCNTFWRCQDQRPSAGDQREPSLMNDHCPSTLLDLQPSQKCHSIHLRLSSLPICWGAELAEQSGRLSTRLSCTADPRSRLDDDGNTRGRLCINAIRVCNTPGRARRSNPETKKQ